MIGSADSDGGKKPLDVSKQPKQRDHAVPRAVRCSHCKKVGIVYFSQGFNVKTADKIMNGRPVIGDCGYCHRTHIELIPIPNLSPSDQKELGHLYKIQETLQYAAEKGIAIPKKSVMLPLKKLEEWQKKMEAMANG